ncbi:MAG: threonine--tRNA ligase [Coriobacteriia bacterium]|nr:threonine--tRNA ligase [Coriobacteriia bacterium]MCL2871051.1 threonine--tRNA ligase [Coriobacteriia bacterium]
MARNPKRFPLDVIRHSTAHLMAAAIKELYPGTVFGIGPSIDDGFYYDMQLHQANGESVSLSPDDLDSIDAKMRELVAEDLPFEEKELSKGEARTLFADQPFKLELIDELPDDEALTVYTCGNFTDLCRGPHLPSTGYIKYFKLMKLAGAYWRSDSGRPMLQRIYGTSWQKAGQLTSYLEMLEEAEKRDHRRLGKELDLFSFSELGGAGFPLYHPKGARVLQILQDWLRDELYKRDYVEARTPHMYRTEMWKMSGHFDNYKDDMYFVDVAANVDVVTDSESSAPSGDGVSSEKGQDSQSQEFAIKPMNCPGHMLIYAANLHSYRDLPVRMFEFGTVYRHELSGVAHGLMRARGFTQDDAHIFCRPDQVNDEVLRCLELVDYVMSTFGFEYTAELSTRPEKSMGSDETWELTTRALEDSLKEYGIEYAVSEGDGAFYGPKIDIHLRDALGRTWQCSTIQFDALLPERFNLEYRTADNKAERPLMLHRAILGSMERFFGILLEHYGGALPSWLAPTQATLIPINDEMISYAQDIQARLATAGFRIEIDEASAPMKAKIAKAQQQKIPYMLVVGKKEAESGQVALRHRTEGDLGAMTVEDFIARLESESPS